MADVPAFEAVKLSSWYVPKKADIVLHNDICDICMLTW